MRNAIIGIVIGIVVGVVIGATLLAPRLDALAIATTGEPVESLAPPAEPEPQPEPAQISLRMASAYPGGLPQIGTFGKRIESEVFKVSDGKVEIGFNEPDTLVPVRDMFDAVASGAIDAAFATPGYWHEKIPALQLFASVPFGPEAPEFLAWFYFGGGSELYEKLYHRHGVHGVVCGVITAEASGWFRQPIVTIDDLKGKRMRIFGLAGDVLSRLGVETVTMAPAEIPPAFESGMIDAAEFSMPAIDLKLGLHKMAKHYYFPGWHQPSTLFDLIVNLETWQSLPSTVRTDIETVCGDNVRYGLAEGEASQFDALKALYAKGVEIHQWPREILSALEDTWQDVVRERSEADEDFRRVWKSLSAFREDYSVWSEISHM